MTVLERDVLNDMIQDELIIQSAKDLKISVADADISPQVDAQIRNAKLQMSEAEFRAELVKAGLGTPEEYRKYLMEQYRRQYTARARHRKAHAGRQDRSRDRLRRRRSRPSSTSASSFCPRSRRR